jgi:hypothetical protein
MTVCRPKAVLMWGRETFGEIALDRNERACRFLEEALELAQCEGVTCDRAHRIMQRVYSRPKGELGKEIGQAMITLEILAENAGISAEVEAAREFSRLRSIFEIGKPLSPQSEPLELAIIEPPQPRDWPADWQEQFWGAYPRRVGKGEAMRRLEKIRAAGKVPFQQILNAALVYRAETQNKEMQYIAHPATWINRGQWEDDPAAIAGRRDDGRGEIKNGFLGRFMDQR